MGEVSRLGLAMYVSRKDVEKMIILFSDSTFQKLQSFEADPLLHMLIIKGFGLSKEVHRLRD